MALLIGIGIGIAFTKKYGKGSVGGATVHPARGDSNAPNTDKRSFDDDSDFYGKTVALKRYNAPAHDITYAGFNFTTANNFAKHELSHRSYRHAKDLKSSNPKTLCHADKQDIGVKKSFRINFQKSCSGFEELLRPRGLTQHASAATADLVGLIWR